MVYKFTNKQIIAMLSAAGLTVILMFLLFILYSCNTSDQTQTPGSGSKEMQTQTSLQPLQPRLDSLTAESKKMLSEETQQIFQNNIDQIANSGIIKDALNVGDTAVTFTLPNAVGEEISLKDKLAKGPVVIAWYRGTWCPYCNIEIAALQEALPYIRDYDASVVAISPQLPDKSLSMKEKHNLEFEVLSDIGNQIAWKYGIVHSHTDKAITSLSAFINLYDYNGDSTNILPLPATYVVDTDGVIRYAFLNPDYKKRAEPAEILEVLRKIKNGE